MNPREAERKAYESLKHLANADFNDKLYDSLAYVAMSFAEQAMPKATPEDVRNMGVELKKKLPPVVQKVQMDARSLFRKVEAARHKDRKERRKNKKSFKSLNAIRLDREGYLNSLPSHKKILLEGYVGSKQNVKEPFIIGKILNAVLKPIIAGLMPLVTKFIQIGVKALLTLLPIVVNQVFIPLVNTLIDLVTSILTDPKMMKAIINII